METVNLDNYDSSSEYSSMTDSIIDSKENKLSLKNLSHRINYNNEMLLYDENIFYNYKNYLTQFRIAIEIDESFYYKPELLSKEIYGTPDLWFLIMWMNDEIQSPMDFNKPIIWVFDPEYINVLNKIIESNKEKLEKNKEEPEFVEDLTLKKVLISDNRII